MAFCGKCGAKLIEGNEFCKSCGAPEKGSNKTPQEKQTVVSTKQPIPKEKPRKRFGGGTILVVSLILLFLFGSFFIGSFFILSLIGAQGQPATIIPPTASSGGTSGSSIPIPADLSADNNDSDINLNWDAISTADLKTYKVYKSLEPGKKYSLAGKVSSSKTNYKDEEVKKGITYYYVVTAVTADEAESGNSSQVSGTIEAPPLVPKGIYSWSDVKKQYEADPEYLKLLTKITGLTKSDVERLVKKESDGMTLSKILKKGTIVTNTTKKYKILPNYKLKKDRVALTDEQGTPHVLTKCGNPMKIQVPVSTTAVFIQQVQVFVTNVVMIMPPSITNVIINAAQPVNDVTIAVMPSGIRILLGSTYALPPSDVFIDPADLGADYGHFEEPSESDESDAQLEEGEKWIEEGKLLVKANPVDPNPGQSVTMTVRLLSKKSGVKVDYAVTGTDGYKKSNSATTDGNGEITFSIPGGKKGIKDSITVNVPSEGLNGSAEYQF